MEINNYANHDMYLNNDYMNDIFLPRDGFKWFIEHNETHLWLCEEGSWTNDPHKCLHYDTEPKACVASFKYSTEMQKYFIITEHEFVPPDN